MVQRKRNSAKKSAKTVPLKAQLLKIVLSLAILSALIVAAALLLHRTWLRPQTVEKPAVTAEKPLPEEPRKSKTKPAPRFEIFPPDAPEPQHPIPPPEPAARLPKVALIIDDLGYDLDIARRFLSLSDRLTVSVLPYSPYQTSIVRLAGERGVEVLLHQPMEPNEYPDVDPGPGTLLTTMTPDELIAQLEKNLAAVTEAKGVNNHMGSKMTAASDQVNQIFSILKKHRLFFIDSRTTPESRCKSSARLLQLPFAQRDVFLDHQTDPAFISRQLDALVRIAHAKGHAIAIAHPHRATYNILQQKMPALSQQIAWVPASELVYPPTYP